MDFTGRTLLLTLDHVIPKSKGGSSDLNNLVTCCRKCNRRKKDNLFELFEDYARKLAKTLLWKVNRSLLKQHLFSAEVTEILKSVLVSVVSAKKVLVYFAGEEHVVLEWTGHFVLRNAYTGACFSVEPPPVVTTKSQDTSHAPRRGRHVENYGYLERMMQLRAVTHADINGHL